MKRISLLFAAAFFALAAPANTPQPAEIMHVEAVGNTEVVPLTRHITADAFVVTFLVTGTDWNSAREQLLSFKQQFENQHGKLNNFSLVCYNDRASAPNVTNDADAAYQTAYDRYRACSLEMRDGKMVFNYGGVVAGQKTNNGWKNTQFWDKAAKAWK